MKIKNFFDYFSGDDNSYNPNDKTANSINLRYVVGSLAEYIKSSEIREFKTNKQKYPNQKPLNLKFTYIEPKKAKALDNLNEIVVFMEQRRGDGGLLPYVKKYLESSDEEIKEKALSSIISFCKESLYFKKAD